MLFCGLRGARLGADWTQEVITQLAQAPVHETSLLE